jgi:serine/threonine protein kinase
MASPSIRTERSSPLPPPAPRIGPYVLGKTLGVGSTGRVKLGTHVETNSRVAIKIIPKDALSQADHNSTDKRALSPEKQAALSKKIEREITIMKLVQHPHVMQLYDVYETDKELYVTLNNMQVSSSRAYRGRRAI